MHLFFDISLPFKDPVLIFSLVLFIILLAPIILNKIRIPGIVGLIIAGVLIGPNGFNILQRDASFELFGKVGLLYLMFLAGLDLDINEFNKRRYRSIAFGVLTFIIPFSVGALVSFYILRFNISSSIILAIMFSTQTLVAYPIVSRLGINKNEAVAITVGGTIITDTLVLLILSTVAAATNGELNHVFWVKISISVVLLIILILWGFPAISRWFFKNIEGEKSSQFIFVLALVFFAAFLAQLAGVESIIGAFLAGLALNRLIPSTSALMNRLEFVGNSLFIPFFLISVGMFVDIRVLFNGTQALMVAGTLLVVAFLTKWIAAYSTQKLFRYSKNQRNLIFGLSSSHAAAALAVVLIGHNLHLLNDNVLNGTILLILISCLAASFITENAGRKIAISEIDKKPLLTDNPERILVSVANPENLEKLMDLAIMLKDRQNLMPVYTLAVVDDDNDAREKLIINKKLLEKTVIQGSATETSVEVITRIDINVASGIIRTVKEKTISDIIIGWQDRVTPEKFIFGGVLDKLLESCYKAIFVSKLIQPLNTTKKIIVAVTPNAELEIGFEHWLEKINILSKQIGAGIIYFANETTNRRLKILNKGSHNNAEAKHTDLNNWDNFIIVMKEITIDDMFILISARKGTISYNNELDSIPRLINKSFPYVNSIIIFPEQYYADNSEET